MELLHWASLAMRLVFPRVGIMIAARMPMMAMTVSSSIRVKPLAIPALLDARHLDVAETLRRVGEWQGEANDGFMVAKVMMAGCASGEKLSIWM
jgi:hypothetical protein